MLNTDKKYIDAIVTLVKENNNFIVYDYKGKENQILVKKELVDKILRYIQETHQEVHIKEFLKFSIRQSLDLEEHDIVISKNGHFFIKLVHKIQKVHVTPSEENTKANRYSGFSEEEMKSFYTELFSCQSHSYFFNLISQKFIDIHFHANCISNEMYEKNVFAYIQNVILEYLLDLHESENDDDDFFKGFAGYVFRIHFKEVFEHIADILLDEISMGNKNIISFLNYYSSDVIVTGGHKFQVPIIEAESGLRWNVISMLSIAKIYTKTAKSIKALQAKISIIKEKSLALYVNNLSPVKYHAAFIKKRQKIEQHISETSQKLDTYIDAFKVAKKEEEKKSLQAEVKSIEGTIKDLRVKKSELSKKMIKQSTIHEYNDLQVTMDSLSRHINSEQKILKQNQTAYASMRNSLVKALVAKKKKI